MLRRPQGREKLFRSLSPMPPPVRLSPLSSFSGMGTGPFAIVPPPVSYGEHKLSISDLTFPCAVSQAWWSIPVGGEATRPAWTVSSGCVCLCCALRTLERCALSLPKRSVPLAVQTLLIRCRPHYSGWRGVMAG